MQSEQRLSNSSVQVASMNSPAMQSLLNETVENRTPEQQDLRATSKRTTRDQYVQTNRNRRKLNSSKMQNKVSQYLPYMINIRNCLYVTIQIPEKRTTWLHQNNEEERRQSSSGTRVPQWRASPQTHQRKVTAESVYWKNPTSWWDDYEQDELVVIDNYYGQWPLQDLLFLFDKSPYKVNCKGYTAEFLFKRIIVIFYTRSTIPMKLKYALLHRTDFIKPYI